MVDSVLDYIWLIPLLPLLGAAILGLLGKRLPLPAIPLLACGVVAGSFLIALVAFLRVSSLDVTELPVNRDYFTWIEAGTFESTVGLMLDRLSGIMILIVTGVGFLIHVYSAGYMKGEDGLYRYFAYLNLFTFAMLTLVLANNYLLLFVGWEGVGLCSYLLIGFWFSKRSAADAGKKAFVVNRVGDFGFILAALLIFVTFGSVGFEDVFATAGNIPAEASGLGPVTAICLLMLLGATGKSAQLPLYVWLPDAMEGPTPVSALIHAATMVTAGVYMVARSAALFSLSPNALVVVAGAGALTALFAATIALVQTDIKRVLAYSTVSQLGYMFLACGVGAYAAAIFHLMTHAFFKALLFLGAGSVIHGMNGVQDMRKMGGLHRQMPWTFWTFVVGSVALAGIPPFAGFFSKDAILWAAWTHEGSGPLLWTVGVLTAGLTAFYVFRLVFLTFFGAPRYTTQDVAHVHESPPTMLIPLVILAGLSALAGFTGVPEVLLGENRFEHFLEPVFGATDEAAHASLATELVVMGASVGAGIVGVFLAYLFYRQGSALPGRTASALPFIDRTLRGRYYVDELYNAVFVSPTVRASRGFLWRVLDTRLIDGTVDRVGWCVNKVASILRRMQSGYVRSYAAWIVVGVLFLVAWLVRG